MKHEYFKSWIKESEWGIKIAVFLVLLCSLAQFATFALSQNYVVSYFGAQPEDVTFAVQITYIGILSTLPIQFRFLRYFETRSYLLLAILAGIVLNILILYTRDMMIFCLLRFLVGVDVCIVAAGMLTLIFSRLKTEQVQAVGLSVFYGTVLSSGVVVGIAAAWVNSQLNWTAIYYFLIGYQVLCLLILLLILKPISGHQRYPLYQIDWMSVPIFILAFTSLAYVMIYGNKYYWFSDYRIGLLFLAFVLATAAFIFRQLTIKRPLFRIDLFKYKNFMIGLILLLFYYGIKDSLNLIYSYTGTVLQWPPAEIIQLGIFNITGLALAMWASAKLILSNRHSIKKFLLAGFGIMLSYQLYVYYLLTPDLAFTDLILPVFLQGVASGILFVPLVVFTLSSVPATSGTSGTVLCACARFTATLHSITGFDNLQLYFNQHYKSDFLSNLSAMDFPYEARISSYVSLFKSKGFNTEQANTMATSSVARLMAVQNQLLTQKSIFLFASVLVVVVIFFVVFIPSLRKTSLHLRKRMFILPRR